MHRSNARPRAALFPGLRRHRLRLLVEQLEPRRLLAADFLGAYPLLPSVTPSVATDVPSQSQAAGTGSAAIAHQTVGLSPAPGATSGGKSAAIGRPAYFERLGGELTEIAENMERRTLRGPVDPRTAAELASRLVVDAIAVADAETLRADLQRLAIRVDGNFGQVISASVPVAQLQSMANLTSLSFARPALATTSGGLVTSQADTALAASAARSAFGLGGSGVTIGVLSDTFDNHYATPATNAAADVASGDLPAGGVTVLDEGNDRGSDEGRAMLQLVHDLAPGADLLFHTAFDGVASFAQGILDLGAAGADVIVDDVIYFAEPMFQDGPIAQAVDEVVGDGAVYFSSAGNSASQSWEDFGGFRNSGATGEWGRPLHDFDPGTGVDPFQQITVPVGSTVIFSFQWDQPFKSAGGTGSASDVDFVVLGNSANPFDEILATGWDSNIGRDAVEVVGFRNDGTIDVDGVPGADTVFNLAIELYEGPQPGRMKYVYFGGGTSINEYATGGSTAYGHANAAGAVAVGAAFYGETPAYGTNPPLAEPFTSTGGPQILFAPSGARLISPEARLTPDITAVDGTNTTFFGSDVEGDGFPNFFGTSAAAPHAAAVAALMIEAAGGAGVAEVNQIQRALTSTALDMGSLGFDDTTGFGLIQADSAIESLLADLADDPVTTWIPQGPFSAINGQVENIAGRPVTGAIHTVLADPTNADVLWIGATNGGIWKTENASDPAPTWQPLTDTASSQSMGALAFDAADSTYQTVYAGNGRYSSFGRIGTGRDGLMRTIDGGASWERLGSGRFSGANISGIVANGNNVVVSVNVADVNEYGKIGIFRSTDGGVTFGQISDSSSAYMTGLPGGSSYDLAADPTDPNIMYTSIVFADTLMGGSNGIYKSTDGGGTWARVSNPAMQSLITNSTSNIEIAVGTSNNVYVAIINAGRLDGLFRSGDGGSTWTQMDTPSTNENGTDVGLNPNGSKGPLEGTPEEIAGGQGSIHFSILADPTDPNIVYVGGDRQPTSNGDRGTFPNSIGANDYTGRLFRGDASAPAGSQFVHLTHSSDLGPDGGGTASSSAPHADSRDMVFDASGNLIEVDDGGIYRRTAPRSDTGDWFSVIGNLQVAEIHDIAYDHVHNVLISGNQDTGTTQQSVAGDAIWTSIHTADGGDVAVDEITLAGSSQTIRYSSYQNLAVLRRRTYDAAGSLVAQAFPALTVSGGGAALDPAFRTPLELNAVDPTRLIVMGENSTYESLDQAETLIEIGPGLGVGSIRENAVAYGGWKDGVPNEDVLWVGSGNRVYVRTAPGAPLARTLSNPSTTAIFDLTIDPSDWATAAVIDNDQLFFTQDAGISWSDFTGNLAPLNLTFSSVAYVSGIVDALVLGTSRGVFASAVDALGSWMPLGTDLPTALVYDMEYDAADDVLAVGTLGRGAWLLGEVGELLHEAFAPTSIAGRHIFYNASVFDGERAGVDGPSDASAIASDKAALLPGDAASFANYTSYSRGINGIMLDIANPQHVLSADDFEFRIGNDDDPANWELAPAPTAVGMFSGGGTDGADRVVITWADGQIAKTWLQVTVKASANTGLQSPDVHYWGNWVGETGNSTSNTVVNTFDQLRTRINFTTSSSPADVDNPYDFNRDGKVNTFDQLLARINFTTSTQYLNLISPPATVAASAPAPEAEMELAQYAMGVDSFFATTDKEKNVWGWL